jgi:hypothetical protein
MGGFMKRILPVVVFISFFLGASVCSAAYLIHLKDGRDITTHEYWDEGDQIKIKQYGGVVGISKDDVVSIEETDDVKTIVVESPPETNPEEANEKAETPQQKEEAKKEKSGDVKKEEKPEKPNKEKAPKEKNPFLKEFESLKKRFQRVDTMPVEALLVLNRQLKNLRNKIIKAGLAGPYADQMVGIYDMITRVEEIYHKKKNQ